MPPYSTDETLANTIIQREGIEISWVFDADWMPPEQAIAWISYAPGPHGASAADIGPWMAETAAAAAMYCYVASKLGDVWRAGSPIIN